MAAESTRGAYPGTKDSLSAASGGQRPAVEYVSQTNRPAADRNRAVPVERFDRSLV